MASAAESVAPAAPPASYGYPLALLTAMYVVNFVDRQIVSIVAEPIKAEFALKDWQLGSLTGLAFAILYTIAGFPIARLAERGDRARIIGVAVITWSAFTAVCGMATGFVSFLLARIGVGVGEAGCTPPAHSLIADIVPAAKRASALAIYTMGAPIGQVIGLIAGGFVAAEYGWRAVFYMAAAPGVVLMLLALFTLPEPRRARPVVLASDAPPFRDVIGALLRNRAFVLIVMGASASSFFYYGVNAFYPSFFLRNHASELAAEAARFGLKPIGLLGLTLGVGTGVGGVAGAVLGGRLGDAWAKRDIAGHVLFPAIGAPLMVLLLFAAMLAPGLWLSVALVSLTAGVNAAWVGSFFAAALSLAHAQSRATASALVLFAINMIGLGLGPLSVGLISDALTPGMGSGEGLRWAMISTASVGLIAGGLFWVARVPFRRRALG